MKYPQFNSACETQPYRGSFMTVARLHEKTNTFCTPLYVDFFPSGWVHVGKAPIPSISFSNQLSLLYFIVAIHLRIWSLRTTTCFLE
jgi:hypothetical protein